MGGGRGAQDARYIAGRAWRPPVLLSLVVLLAALALPASAAADASVTPLLTGGELHWTGSAKRVYHGHSDDGYISRTDDASSAVSWDSRMLLAGHYPDDPVTPLGQDGVIVGTDYKTVIGSGTETVTEACDTSDPDCQANITPSQTCGWTETANGPGAFVMDPPVGRQYAVEAFGADTEGNRFRNGHSDYSCADQYNLYDPGMWQDCDTLNPVEANVCGFVFAFPDRPAEGAAATITRHFDHASSQADCARSDDTESCAQTGSSTLTVTCALCVTGIDFQQPDLPSRNWIDVGPRGTFDGNDVRITATIHNATAHAITAAVRFRDLTTNRDLPALAGGEAPPAQVSFPARADVRVVLDWDTDGFAWYLPHKPDPHKIAVLTPYGGARRDLAVRPKPVLLVHGWNSDASTWDGYPDRFKGIRDDWISRAVTGMNTNPYTGNSLVQNARILGRSIEQLRDEYDAEHVDLVVHSMGGLISRQYLNDDAPDDPDHRPVVSHLVMLGTPNRGSPCAYLIGTIAEARHKAGTPTLELTPEFVEGYFDKLVTKTRGTKLSVLAGIADRGVLNQDLSHALCGLPKPNDLVVWRESAFWTLTDTATQDGLVHTDMTTDGLAFSSFVAPHLEVTPDGPVPGAGAAGAQAAAVRGRSPLAGSARAKVPAPDATPGIALSHAATVRGHRSVRVAVPVGSGRALGALVVAPAGIKARLLDPRGKTAAEATSTGGFTNLAARTRRHGRWAILLTNTGRASATIGVVAAIQGDRFTVRPKLRVAHKRLALTVSVRGAGRHVRAGAVALSLRGKGKRVKVHLRRHGSRFVGHLERLEAGTFVTITVRGSRGTRTATAAAP